MGHIRDRWTGPGANGRRIKNSRWGKGRRWQARWAGADGVEEAKAFSTRDEAVTHLAQVETGAIATGQADETGPRFRDYAEDWLASRIGLRPNSLTQIRSRLDVRILPAFGDQDITTITRLQVKAAVAKWAGGAAPRTVRSTYGTLSQILKDAALDGVLPANPAKGVEMPRLDRGQLDIPDASKVREIEDGMPAHLRSMAVVAAATGLRLGELRGLTADRIKGGKLTVDRQLNLDGTGFGDPKTAAGHRTIEMGKVAREAIQAHIKTYGTGPHGLIWRTKDDRPLTHGRARQTWAAMRKKVPGLPDRGGWHLLRHFNASVLIAAGLSVRAVADRLGHDDPAITLRTYSHLWPTDQAAAVKAIDAVLG